MIDYINLTPHNDKVSETKQINIFLFVNYTGPDKRTIPDKIMKIMKMDKTEIKESFYIPGHWLEKGGLVDSSHDKQGYKWGVTLGPEVNTTDGRILETNSVLDMLRKLVIPKYSAPSPITDQWSQEPQKPQTIKNCTILNEILYKGLICEPQMVPKYD